jgi:hypothetical protein
MRCWRNATNGQRRTGKAGWEVSRPSAAFYTQHTPRHSEQCLRMLAVSPIPIWAALPGCVLAATQGHCCSLTQPPSYPQSCSEICNTKQKISDASRQNMREGQVRTSATRIQNSSILALSFTRFICTMAVETEVEMWLKVDVMRRILTARCLRDGFVHAKFRNSYG